MNLGAEPKKVAILGVLVVGGGYVFYANVLSGPGVETKKTPAQSPLGANVPAATKLTAAPPNIRRAKGPIRGASGEFRPKVTAVSTTVDPELNLDLLAKVQAVEPEGGSRSLFQFSTAPPPTEGTKPGKEVATIHPIGRPIGPDPPPPPPVQPPPPPPPPISLKFYGYSTPKPDGQKRAFFLDGEDIFVAAEGELIKKRYRVVQIGVNSVVMEDTEFKNNRQTLVIQQEQAG